MHVGYARVSAIDQQLESQLARLAECEKVFSEKQSGLDSRRPQLAACLEFVRAGDLLIVTRLDRLARSVIHLCEIAHLLERKGVQLVVLDQALDTSTSSGRLLFNMLGAIAQFETEIRAERQRDGIAHARTCGVRFGRRPALAAGRAAELAARRAAGASIGELAREFRVSPATIYRALARPTG